MKLSVLLLMLLVATSSFAQTLKEKKIKKQMLERADSLIQLIDDARDYLKQDDIVAACGKVQEAFVIYPRHLEDIGVRMNLLRGRPNKAKNEALTGLIKVHRQSVICAKGKDAEFVDPKKMKRTLRTVYKSLKKQRRIIKHHRTENSNQFYYNYRFDF